MIENKKWGREKDSVKKEVLVEGWRRERNKTKRRERLERRRREEKEKGMST